MASQKLLDMMNQGIAMELQVSIQYMWQHVMWKGIKGFAVRDNFKSIAVQEMKHSEMIAERIFYLGAIPTIKPTPIVVGENLKAMIAQDVKDEEGAIKLYKSIIELAQYEKDYTTKEIFEHILQEEEDHHDTFSSLLEEEA